jgi:hypothetical protein
MKKIKSMTTSRRKLTANFIYDFLYVIGGQDSSRKIVNLNEGYPPKTVRWTPHRNLQSQDTGLQQKKLTVRSTAQGGGPDPRVEL